MAIPDPPKLRRNQLVLTGFVYIGAVIAAVSMLAWISKDSISYTLFDAHENREFTLWNGAIYLTHDVTVSPRIDGRFELKSSRITNMSGENIRLWHLGVMFVAIPAVLVILAGMARHWWRIAEASIRRIGVAILLVSTGLWFVSAFVCINLLGNLKLYYGGISISIGHPFAWYDYAPIGAGSREFYWFPFVRDHALFLPIWLIALGLWFSNYFAAIHSKLPEHPLCKNCGYNLNVNTSGKCPECGRLIKPEQAGSSDA